MTRVLSVSQTIPRHTHARQLGSRAAASYLSPTSRSPRKSVLPTNCIGRHQRPRQLAGPKPGYHPVSGAGVHAIWVWAGAGLGGSVLGLGRVGVHPSLGCTRAGACVRFARARGGSFLGWDAIRWGDSGRPGRGRSISFIFLHPPSPSYLPPPLQPMPTPRTQVRVPVGEPARDEQGEAGGARGGGWGWGMKRRPSTSQRPRHLRD
ncbi:hypothetical protein DFH07DRAFT_511222 [Mycena maculata]|uniref:Uncharacterized protein n=1 Tax=Mycena maculata TaxID=230809 RepID=A0AAD7IYN6_9AGAR|nr:hypothetical protein DFH07DRAFT_511222 [Mycena maculata]